MMPDQIHSGAISGDNTFASFFSWRKTGLIIALIGMITSSAFANTLPIRENSRPSTTDSVPHIQIGVEAVPAITQEFMRKISVIEGIDIQDSILSLPGAVGFWISDDVTLKNPDAIIRGREFAHIHPDGSFHASLDPEIAKAAVKAGWATPHPWSNSRPGWEGFVMIYTPLNEKELETVFQLVLGSFGYVTGKEI